MDLIQYDWYSSKKRKYGHKGDTKDTCPQGKTRQGHSEKAAKACGLRGNKIPDDPLILDS